VEGDDGFIVTKEADRVGDSDPSAFRVDPSDGLAASFSVFLSGRRFGSWTGPAVIMTIPVASGAVPVAPVRIVCERLVAFETAPIEPEPRPMAVGPDCCAAPRRSGM